MHGPLGISECTTAPAPGDLILARVDALGFHSGLQLPNGRRRRLFVGNEIVVAYGNRYAPNQFEAVVPRGFGPCQLVAGGGVAARVLSWHGSITKSATQITPLAVIAGPTGATANLRDYALPSLDRIPTPQPRTLVVCGTSMDSGKTQTAAYLVKGLSLAGLRVGFAKITGTGSGGDTWLLKDAGANPVLDFTDAGLASTYLIPAWETERVYTTLVGHLALANVDAIVLEIADGVLQVETAALLKSALFSATVDGVLFACGDAMGALAGENWLRRNRLPLIALSGIVSSSPLQRQEAAKSTGLPVLDRQDLLREQTVLGLLSATERRARGRMPRELRNGNGNGNAPAPGPPNKDNEGSELRVVVPAHALESVSGNEAARLSALPGTTRGRDS
ncbi:MAG: DUF1611 domain-containing protein [Candidatus Eisenbacteria bacterium]